MGAVGAKEFSNEGSIPYADYYRLFLDGNAGMVIASHSFMGNLEHVDFSWALVSQPVNSSDRQAALDFDVYEVFGINEASKNTEAAWEFIKHIHSDRVMNSQSLTGGIPTRIKYAGERVGHDLIPFYNIKANISQQLSYIEMPESFMSKFRDLANERFYQMLQGEMGVEEALSQLEQSGRELLDELKLTVE